VCNGKIVTIFVAEQKKKEKKKTGGLMGTLAKISEDTLGKDVTGTNAVCPSKKEKGKWLQV
tara:strand:- start:899 stop:1081 length:183 start_codon:yes stop_codon:yes gene_type:complete